MLICCGARIVQIRSGWMVRICCELGQLALRSVPPERGLSQSAAAGQPRKRLKKTKHVIFVGYAARPVECSKLHRASWDNSRSVCEFEIQIRTSLKPVES